MGGSGPGTVDNGSSNSPTYLKPEALNIIKYLPCEALISQELEGVEVVSDQKGDEVDELLSLGILAHLTLSDD